MQNLGATAKQNRERSAAERPGPDWTPQTSRSDVCSYWVLFNVDPVVPLRFAPGSAFLDPHRCVQAVFVQSPGFIRANVTKHRAGAGHL